MIEINSESKAKFFAQHIGAEILYPDTDNKIITAYLTGISISDGIETTYKRKKKGCSGDYLSFKSNGNHNSDALHAKIILKPLSSITDEDAIEVAEFMGLTEGDFEINHRPTDIHIDADSQELTLFFEDCSIYFNDFNSDEASTGTDYLSVYDYLRSKGYALPWMGLSVEQMVEAGWIKLQEVKDES